MTQLPEIDFELSPNIEETAIQPVKRRSSTFWEVVRFAIVGVANTAIDLFVLNCLLIIFPTHNVAMLVVYNSVAYSAGACNSFILNKYWTFRCTQKTTKGELLRFALVNLCGIFCNSGLLWVAAEITHPLMSSVIVWANFSKVFAIAGTATVSFLAIRLWVFADKDRPGRKTEKSTSPRRV